MYFEIVAQAAGVVGVGGGAAGPSGSIQFMTHYTHSSGSQRLRVTTVNRPLRDGGSPEIPASFDQETAAVLMARIAVFKSEVDDGPYNPRKEIVLTIGMFFDGLIGCLSVSALVMPITAYSPFP